MREPTLSRCLCFGWNRNNEASCLPGLSCSATNTRRTAYSALTFLCGKSKGLFVFFWQQFESWDKQARLTHGPTCQVASVHVSTSSACASDNSWPCLGNHVVTASICRWMLCRPLLPFLCFVFFFSETDTITNAAISKLVSLDRLEETPVAIGLSSWKGTSLISANVPCHPRKLSLFPKGTTCRAGQDHSEVTLNVAGPRYIFILKRNPFAFKG